MANNQSNQSVVADEDINPIQTTSYEVDEQDATVFYEIFVRAFYDSNGDGISDLK